MKYKIKYSLITIAIFIISTINCAGSRGSIKFSELKYPASMSGYLYNNKKETLVKGDKLKVVQNFSYQKTFWSILYSYKSLSDEEEIVMALNEAIKDNNGYGVINLSAEMRACKINSIPVLSVLPIWPGCADITLKGEIVKVE